MSIPTEDILSPYRILTKSPEFFLIQHRLTSVSALYKEFYGKELSPSELSLITSNLSLRKSLPSPNLLSILAFSVQRQDADYKFSLIYEHWLQSFSKELELRLETENYWSEDEILNTLEAVLHGLYALHAASLTHGNITAGNIVVSANGFVKLADQFVTSPCFRRATGQIFAQKHGVFPPEIQGFQWVESREADLWSIGMIFLEAATLKSNRDCLDYAKGEVLWPMIQDRMAAVRRVYGLRVSGALERLLGKREEREMVYGMFGIGVKIEKTERSLEGIEGIFERHRKEKSAFVSYLKREIGKREASIERLKGLLREAERMDIGGEDGAFPLREIQARSEKKQEKRDLDKRAISNISSEKNEESSSESKPAESKREGHKPSSLALIKDKYSGFGGSALPSNQLIEEPGKDKSKSEEKENLENSGFSDKFGDFSIIKTEDEPRNTSFDSKLINGNQLKTLNKKLDDCIARSRSVSPGNSIDYASNRDFPSPNTSNLINRSAEVQIAPSLSLGQPRGNHRTPPPPDTNPAKDYAGSEKNNAQGDLRIRKLFFENGEYYEGEVAGSTSQASGYGTLYSRDGRAIYQGEWSFGRFHGHGIKYNLSVSGSIDFKGGFPYQDFSKLRGGWVKYEGGWKEGKRHGSGVLSLANKESFQGMFCEDRVHGKGTFQGLKARVIGEWKDNRLVHRIN